MQKSSLTALMRHQLELARNASSGRSARTVFGGHEQTLRQTMIALASASLGLVAALAWNEAIKATLAYLGLGDSLAGLYTYAIIATVIAVAVLVWLGKLAARVGGEAAFSREAEG